MANSEQSNNKNVSLSLIAEYGGSDSESDTETRSNTTGNESDASELSEMVLKNNLINACAHGPLSRPSNSEDVTRHMIIGNCESGVVEYEVEEYRDMDTDSDSSSSSDSDIESVKDIEELSSGDEYEGSSRGAKHEPTKVVGELGLDDLPPIEDLAISLPAQECTKIGTITSIVDRLVIVNAFRDTPTFDLDSVLFLENGAKTLGKVYDIIGPVKEPHYCVRFNSEEHVKSRGIEPGMDVFIAPQSQHTNYVFLSELMKYKGSDASWFNDVEPPPNQIDYSDDEQERKAKREQKKKKQPEDNENDAENARNVRKPPERRNQRPSESSSRFGSGPSRGRNPFHHPTSGLRRPNVNCFSSRFTRPWAGGIDLRTPPPHPNDSGGPYSAPPFPNRPMLPPFNPLTPPPFGNMFQFGNNPRMHNPMGHQYRQMPVFGSNVCNEPGTHPRWTNNGPSPPPGT